MPALHLTQFTWISADPTDFYWRLPLGALGGLDLRSIPQHAAGPTAAGFGVVVLPAQGNSVGPYLGDNLSGMMLAPRKTALRNALGIGEAIVGTTLLDVLWELFTQHADPTGQTRWRPIMPTAQGIMELHLGGFSLVRAERFDRAQHPLVLQQEGLEWKRLKETCAASAQVLQSAGTTWEFVSNLWAGMRSLSVTDPAVTGSREWRKLAAIVSLTPPLQHQRRLTALAVKYRMRPEELLDLWGEPYVEPLPHSTTITESFNKADADTLGPDLTWTEFEGDTDVVSNEAVQQTAAARCSSRADSDLASDDHYAQAQFQKVSGGSGGRRFGAVSRKDGTTTVTFYKGAHRGDIDEDQFIQLVSGTRTIVGSTADVLSFSTWYTLKMESDGSSHRVFRDGVVKLGPTTDTVITGNLRTGISLQDGTAGKSKADVFEAADLAAGPTTGELIAAAGVGLSRQHPLQPVMIGY